jgi:hypothetical protein
VPLPPGVTIDPPPAHLRPREHDPLDHWWHVASANDVDDDFSPDLAGAKAFPPLIETGAPDALRTTKLFPCSGGVDSSRYMEPTRYRAIPDMTWPEARVALNRLAVEIKGYSTAADYVALAEFTLTVHGFTRFQGARSEHAVKLRIELQDAIRHLWGWLSRKLNGAADHAHTIRRPVTNRLQGDGWRGNAVLWAMVPVANDQWVCIN